MYIEPRYCYDQTADQIFRPCKHVRVTQGLLFHVIKNLEERWFIVVAVVSGSNQGVWKSLSIMVRNVSFPNPSDVRISVWVFTNVPHLIKLLRNIFLDFGRQLRNGTAIRKEHLSNIIEDTELKLCSKLSDVHLNFKRRARQKVKYAVAALSTFTPQTGTTSSFLTTLARPILFPLTTRNGLFRNSHLLANSPFGWFSQLQSAISIFCRTNLKKSSCQKDM
ncbi:hypothetical protein PR048_005475 [Dryococelus australis]|uniref:Transposable element P transposase-like GTP-binding insertion domain-containing protein n=1 Tax=Dryococelus australis TaxID=614101 RepID=A0ABQ9I8A6_9NEOP|nr:hypothetical protein PR048_005475 [Dryococelus australis]